MKFSQVLLVGYYRTKLKAIGIVSERKAAEVAFNLFCTPFLPRSKQESPAIFHKAEKLSLQLQGLAIKGFRWIPQTPNNRTVLICHGFNSCCYKFEKYAALFLKEGFTVIAFDAPAHGLSDGKTLNALMYKQMIKEIDRNFGPIQLLMAHSLGGLAVSLAAEEMQQVEKIILIAPATETSSAVENFCRVTRLKAEARKELENIIEETAGHPAAWFSITRAVQQHTTPVLWIHDKEDTICPYRDTGKIRALCLPHVRFVTTQQLGHNKIYRDPGVQKMVIDFAMA